MRNALATGKQKSTYRQSAYNKQGTSGGDAQNHIHSLAFSPDGKLLVVGDWVGAKVWEPATGKELATLRYDPTRPSSVDAATFSPDGTTLALVWEVDVWLWDVARREERAVLTGDSGHVYGVAFSPDGKKVAAASLGNHVYVWDVATRKRLATVNAEMGVLYAVCSSPDGKRLAAAGEGGVKLWKLGHPGGKLLL